MSLIIAIVPYTSTTFLLNSSDLFDLKEATASCKSKGLDSQLANSFLYKRQKEKQQKLPTPKIQVTSNPASTSISSRQDFRPIFKNPFSETSSIKETARSAEDVQRWLREQNRPKERNLSIISESSTGSCDMYSNADDNSDDEDVLTHGPSSLSKATLKTIELILRKIEVNLGYAAYMQCAGSQSARSQGGTQTPVRGRGSTQGSGKRKSRFEDSLPLDGPDDEDSNKKRRVSITTTEDSEAGVYIFN
jgi:hypothetical protein